MASVALCLCFVSLAQKSEVYVGLHTGMLGYSGSSAVHSSIIVEPGNQFSNNGYTNDQFGKKIKPGIGFSAFFQIIRKNNFIWGLSSGMEVLKNKVKIVAISTPANNFPATGATIFTCDYVNVQPFAGYRFKIGPVETIDLFGGFDATIAKERRHEKGSARQDNTSFVSTTNRERDKIGFDPRLGLGTRVSYKRFSWEVSYWLGLKNVYAGYVGANMEARSRVVRTGLAYHIKPR